MSAKNEYQDSFRVEGVGLATGCRTISLAVVFFVVSICLGSAWAADDVRYVHAEMLSVSKKDGQALVEIFTDKGTYCTASNRWINTPDEKSSIYIQGDGLLEGVLLRSVSHKVQLIVNKQVDGLVVGIITDEGLEYKAQVKYGQCLK